jgi:transposase
MARKRKKEVSPQKLREILRLGLKHELGYREISRSCSVSHVTIGAYLNQVKDSNLTWDDVASLDESKLRQLVQGAHCVEPKRSKPEPDWQTIHKELKRKNVTLQLLWEEYKEQHPDGYQSSQFGDLYRKWKSTISPWMRQNHKAGDKLFVDYTGHTVPIQNPKTGLVHQAEIFVAVLGMSNYTYAEATWDQKLQNWVGSHINAFEFFGGIPRLLVPDNLKSGVTKPNRYDPDINPTYYEMASHYNTAILPARVRKPKDKAKVEVAVQIVERWILAALRNKTFFNLQSLNQEIRSLLTKLNEKPFKKLSGSRRSWFHSMEKAVLLPLPESRYELAEWKTARVNIDYHVELDKHYYSAPYQMVRQEVRIRHTKSVVEIFLKGKRIASHRKNSFQGGHTTIKEHMPTGHREQMEWSPSRILRWAEKVGKSTMSVVHTILHPRKHPEQGYRSCLGILRLGKYFGDERLEAACGRAVEYGEFRYKYIRNILEKGLDKQRSDLPDTQPCLNHQNVRGGTYFK